MKCVAAFKGESGRLAIVERLRIELPSQSILDKYCRVAKALFRSPVAYVSLVGAEQIYFVSRYGLQIDGSPREAGLCAATIKESVRVLRDAREQLRGVRNSLVDGPSGFRFYAGVSLRVEDHPIGALAVASPVPYQANEAELSGLKELGQILESEFQRRLQPFDHVGGLQGVRANGEAVAGLEFETGHGYRRNPSAAEGLQALLRAQRYSMATVLEMAALYAHVREDPRYRMSEKTLYRILELGQRPNGYHHQVLAAVLEVDPGDIYRLLEGGARGAITKWRSADSTDAIFRVARMYRPARAHKRAICIHPRIELRRVSAFRTLSDFLLVQPAELADFDSGRFRFAFIGKDADLNFTPRHLRRSMVTVDPHRVEPTPETNAGPRSIFLVQIGSRMLCARVARPEGAEGIRIFPEPAASVGPVRYGSDEIRILGQVGENPLFQIVLPPEEPFG